MESKSMTGTKELASKLEHVLMLKCPPTTYFFLPLVPIGVVGGRGDTAVCQ